MKQDNDHETAELPGLPTPKRRGRPPLGDQPLTNAERIRRSRTARRNKALADPLNTPWIVQFNIQCSEEARHRFRQIAKKRGITPAELFEIMVAALDDPR